VTAPVHQSRQGRAYREDEVQQLLRDALGELMADGTPFRDLSVERLITQAGMARSTFYKYFDDKSALLHALSATALRRLYAAQRSWLTKGRDVTAQDVCDGMRRLLETYRRDEIVMRAVAEASVYDHSISDAYTSGVLDYARAIERFIRRGQKDGWIDGDVAPADTAQALAWMTERTISQLAADASAQRLDALARTLARIVTHSLLSADAGSPASRLVDSPGCP